MISKAMQALGEEPSAIRELFEYGRKRKEEIGAGRVFDFSLGNPSIPAPEAVREELLRLIAETPAELLHGYTSAAGDGEVRRILAERLSRAHSFSVDPSLLYLTCGAAAGLAAALHALCVPGDEVAVFSPYFPEYRVFAEKAGAKLCEIPCRESDFQIDPAALEAVLNFHTKVLIVNSPNNPTGAVYSEESLKEVAAILLRHREKTGNVVYLLADEPYRELVYTNRAVPFLPALYDAAIVCSSFSKSLSLPGERIGYLLVSPECPGKREVYAAVCGAARSLGYVCAPSLFQRLIAALPDGATADLALYRKNRDRLTAILTSAGYEFSPPDGAFYLFLKAPDGDEKRFSERAKAREILLVPSTSFGCTGWARVAYCVSYDVIENAAPAFRELMNEYREAKK